MRKEHGVVKYNFNWSALSIGVPYITISYHGFALNYASVHKLGSPTKVIVGFDEEFCVIGIKSYKNEQGIKPYVFSSRVRNGWVRIGCGRFIKYLQTVPGVDFSSAKKFAAQYDSKEGILFVPLRDDVKQC